MTVPIHRGEALARDLYRVPKFVQQKIEELGAGRVAQVVVCLPSKPEALSSNSSTTKKKERERESRKLAPTLTSHETSDKICHLFSLSLSFQSWTMGLSIASNSSYEDQMS
jgi:hypothetical protein